METTVLQDRIELRVNVVARVRHEAVRHPQRAYPDDAGWDLFAHDYYRLGSGVFVFRTGWSVRVPSGYYVEVVPRSGIANTHFMLANSMGIIDPGYTGEVRVPLRYLRWLGGRRAAKRMLGSRIAQMIVRHHIRSEVSTGLDWTTETLRGPNGFGSTGER